MELIEQLVCFGLTRQEATLYLTLHTEGEVTGYEAAKLTGISRSNTYTALAGLVEKGAAYIIEGAVTKYTPVDFKEFCDNKIRSLNDMKKQMIGKIPIRREESDGYITIKGEKHIYDKMKNVLLAAKERVYISISNKILQLIEEDLKVLVQKNIKIVIITECPYHLEGAIVYYTDNVENQIRLIVDSLKVLTGEITNTEDSTCLYSKNKNLVVVFKEMLKNEITLIEIKNKKITN